ncbi:MAG TPA: MFS transporter [Candidatus Binatia bacterium]|nr:MFS transporter [Candidatus Binatia bacterium]
MIGGDGLPNPQRRWAVVALFIGTVMSSLDSTIANVALPTIAVDVHASAAASIWVVNAYQLAITVSLLSFSSLGDIFGYTRVYRIAVIVFTIASLLCAVSHSLLALTLARSLQGFAASAQMAVGPALGRSLYPRSQLGRAVSNAALAVGVSATAGPTIAGAVLSVAPWPWLFLINIPTGLIALALTYRFVPEHAGTRHRFDVPSAIGSALAVGLFVLAVDGVGHGVNRFVTAAELVALIAVAAAFWHRQQTLAIPMLAVNLFRRAMFTLSLVTSHISFIGQMLAFVTLPFYFEDVLGFSAAETGLLITSWPLAVTLIAKAAGRLADRYPAGALTTFGMLVVAAGLFLIVILPPNPSPLDIAWRLALCGLGNGFFQTPNNRAIMSSAPVERSGVVGGLAAMARVTGQTVGASLVALVFAAFKAGPHVDRQEVTIALALAITFTLLAAFIGSLRLRAQVESDRAPKQYQTEQRAQDAVR